MTGVVLPAVNYPRRHVTRDKCIHNLLLEHSFGVVQIHLNLLANFTPASGDVPGQYIASEAGHPNLGQVNAGMAGPSGRAVQGVGLRPLAY